VANPVGNPRIWPVKAGLNLWEAIVFAESLAGEPGFEPGLTESESGRSTRKGWCFNVHVASVLHMGLVRRIAAARSASRSVAASLFTERCRAERRRMLLSADKYLLQPQAGGGSAIIGAR